MEYGLQASGTYDVVLAAARWAEDRGLACFAIPDHYLFTLAEEGIERPAPDAFALLGGLARDTSAIRLSVMVGPVTFRHPAVFAKSAFTIDRMSGGRFTLGLGTGWLDLEHEVFGFRYPPLAERYEMMEDALAYVRAMAAGEGFDGRHATLQARDLHPRPTEGFQVVVGGRGAVKTPTLAGRYADEYNMYPDTPEGMRARIALARSEAAAAGRDPDALLISSSGAVLVGADEADYRERLAELAAEDGTTVEEIQAHFEARNTPCGTAEQVQAELAEMAGVGVSRFYLQTMWSDDMQRTGETMDLLGG
ncbi:MAG: LLM class flavin-dependent oxidoreductase [Actinobacteria bacterium]|nr:LLM class flavin-dependent oxidoreductase [Actinomycetota bacterium]